MSSDTGIVDFELKPYTKKDLRLMYGIPLTTFRRWLKAVPEALESGRKNWLTAKQVEAIIKKYGVPGLRKFKSLSI